MSEYERTIDYLDDLTELKKLLIDRLGMSADSTLSDLIPTINNIVSFYNFKTINGTFFYKYFYAVRSSITKCPELDTSEATDMRSMFEGCGLLESVPLFDTSKVTSMWRMFTGCGKLLSIPKFNTANVTDMGFFLQMCKSLVEIPALDCSNVTSMNEAFYYCTSITEFPSIIAGNITNARMMFQQCIEMTKVGIFDTRSITNAQSMFANCWKLKIIPEFDFRNSTNFPAFVQNCSKLEECWIRNIKANLQVGSGTSYGHLLTLESLLHLIKECRNVNAARTLTVGSANLEKLANVYVRLVDITDEMRAEDDLIDEKLPFEVCESTDEGAMTIEEYAFLKQWTIQ